MKLKQLQYFQIAARFQSISKAADYCHVSQPSISKAIMELENEFNVVLLKHRRNSFELSEDGEILLEQIDNLLAQANNLEAIMKDIGKQRHQIRLGIPPMIGSFLFPAIYTAYCPVYPGTNITTVEGGRYNILKNLNEDLLDIAFIPHNIPISDAYHSMKVMDVETVCIVSEQHPLAKKGSVTIQDLANEDLIMFKNTFFQNKLITDFFYEAGLKPRIIHESSQLSTVSSFVSNNIAVGFVFKNLVSNIPDIVSVSFEKPLLLQVSLVWKKNRYMNSDIKNFIRFFTNFDYDNY